MRFSVTNDEITDGRIRDCERCPVALAIRKQLPHLRVSVSKVAIIIQGAVYNVSEPIRKFLLDFDNGRPVEPFEFELPL